MLNISNFFSIINIGYLKKKNVVLIKKTKFNLILLKKLYNWGYIRGYNFNTKNKYKFELFLKYYKNKPLIQNIQFLVAPSRIYNLNVFQIKKKMIYSNLLNVISTSKGLLTSIECVLLNIGGFLVFIF